MQQFIKRRWKVLLPGLALSLAVAAAILLRFGVMNSGSRETVEPFRIAGNLYYVGGSDVTAFLLTGPEGHVLIDGGYPLTAPMIMESIATLGFEITDVRVLLNSHAHGDHAGGLAALQEASGAELWVSEGDADAVASGRNPVLPLWPFKLLDFVGITRYPAARVDHRFEDGATIRVGPIELTAHVTAGHTPGCTSWSFPVHEGERELRAVSICSLTLPPGVSLVEPESYPGIRANFERSFRTLRGLPVDIFLASHTEWFSMERKLRERADTTDPVAPFIDPEGYLRFIDREEEDFREALAEQQAEPAAAP